MQSISNLNSEKRVELDDLIEQQVALLHEMSLFATVNSLDTADIWEMASNAYEDDLTYAPEEE